MPNWRCSYCAQGYLAKPANGECMGRRGSKKQYPCTGRVVDRDAMDFPTPSRTRSTDPVTSQRAGARARPKLSKQRQGAFELVKLFPGLTVNQLAAHAHALLDDERYLRQAQLWRRLPELEKAGYVEPRDVGGRERIWFPKENENAGEQQT